MTWKTTLNNVKDKPKVLISEIQHEFEKVCKEFPGPSNENVDSERMAQWKELVEKFIETEKQCISFKQSENIHLKAKEGSQENLDWERLSLSSEELLGVEERQETETIVTSGKNEEFNLMLNVFDSSLELFWFR